MKLEDFKKAGWNIDKAVNIASKEYDTYSAYFDAISNLAGIYPKDMPINVITLSLDDIATVEEVEYTCKEIISAISINCNI